MFPSKNRHGKLTQTSSLRMFPAKNRLGKLTRKTIQLLPNLKCTHTFRSKGLGTSTLQIAMKRHVNRTEISETSKHWALFNNKAESKRDFQVPISKVYDTSYRNVCLFVRMVRRPMNKNTFTTDVKYYYMSIIEITLKILVMKFILIDGLSYH